MTRTRHSNSESGATLLSVLLIVMLMSAAALGAVEALGRSVQVSKSSSIRSEMLWSARGAAEAGEAIVRDAMTASDGALTLRHPLLTEPVIVPLEHGTLTARFADQSNCFNLNNLFESGKSGEISLPQLVAYQRLLAGLGFLEGESRQLADSLADWLDADTSARASGAEDANYRFHDVPYKAANTGLANTSELYAIDGYSPEVVARIRPVVCVYEPGAQKALNINTLEPKHAALLHAIFSAELSSENAERLIAQRPDLGWHNVAEFLTSEDVARIAEALRDDTALSTQSQRIGASLSLQISGAALSFEAIYARTEASSFNLVSLKRSDPS